MLSDISCQGELHAFFQDLMLCQYTVVYCSCKLLHRSSFYKTHSVSGLCTEQVCHSFCACVFFHLAGQGISSPRSFSAQCCTIMIHVCGFRGRRTFHGYFGTFHLDVLTNVVPKPIFSFQDLKDYMRQAGEVTFTQCHKDRVGEG